MTNEATKILDDIKKPPAIEAVFEIILEEEEDLSVDNLSITDNAFNSRFAKKGQLSRFQGIIEDNQLLSKQIPFGIMYSSTNETELTQFRLNGFSYNNLGDYPGGDEFIKNAIYVWDQYRNCRKKIIASRMGLRFINIIKIPKSAKLTEYFSVNMNFPDNIDKIGKISQFQYRYMFDFFDSKYESIVNFVQQPNDDEYKNFILDIDIIRKELPEDIHNDIIRECFKEMREVKNSVFCTHLTTKALEMYK
ncbi:MAG: TIGR04255 family protein [Pseudomonadota bacterium]